MSLFDIMMDPKRMKVSLGPFSPALSLTTASRSWSSSAVVDCLCRSIDSPSDIDPEPFDVGGNSVEMVSYSYAAAVSDFDFDRSGVLLGLEYRLIPTSPKDSRTNEAQVSAKLLTPSWKTMIPKKKLTNTMTDDQVPSAVAIPAYMTP